MKSKLQFLLGGLDESNFFSEIYGKKQVLLKGNQNKFSNFFNLACLNHVLNFTNLQYPRVRVTDYHNSIHKYDLIDDRDRYYNNINNELNLKKVLFAIAKGGTLVFDKIEEFHPILDKFVAELKHQLQFHVSVNAYYTARHQRGVNVHFDRHDVFAIQIHGNKRWFFREDKHVLSRAIRHQTVPNVDDSYTGWQSVLLEQGDVFYCPRGLWHFTQTENEHSAHLALGLYPMTLRDWIRSIEVNPEVAEILEEFVSHPSKHNNGLVNTEPLERLIEELRSRANQPTAVTARAPRPYIELE